MQNLLKRVGGAILGLVIVLGWWTLRDHIRGDGDTPVEDKIPAKVWAGGGGTVIIEIETSGPAKLNLTFSDEADEKHLTAYEMVGPGRRSWTIDVPAKTSGYIDLTAENPQVGAKLTWTVKVNGQVVNEQSETLDEPLKPNYAFGLQVYFDDYAKGELGDG